MNNMLANWQTTSAGMVLIVLAALQLVGVTIPFVPHIDIVQAVIMGAGLIVAKDANAFEKK